MTGKGLLQIAMAVSLALASELALGLNVAPSAQAQFKPPNIGAPRTTAGGAIRSGSCFAEKTPLKALVPPTNIGLTTESHPTFFLYLPKTVAQSAEFVLRDADQKDVYRAMVPLSGQSGLVSFRLPDDAPELQEGKEYEWFFNVICKPSDRLQDYFVTAWVQRVQPDEKLAESLKTVANRQRPNLFAQAGIWQDTLTVLTELRRGNPADSSLMNEWNELLKSQGLSQVSQVSGGKPANPLVVGNRPN